MDVISAIIENREKGSIPVSIGTSLALEGAFGTYPDRPETPAPILKVKEVWFNIRTVIRNLIESIPTSHREDLTVANLYPAVIEEMTIIESAILRGSNGMAKAIFYCSNYTFLHRQFPRAVLRRLETSRQQFMKGLEEDLVKRLSKDGTPADYRYFSGSEITGNHPEAFIVTHLPVDLLARYRFRQLNLLESHTGVVKNPAQWATKLTGGKENDNIPFCAFTLQLLGDKGNQFAAMPTQLRKQVTALAEQDNWSTVTTRDKIAMSLRKIADAGDRATLMALL